MKYLFSALYVIGTLVVIMNIYLLIISGWAWPPAIKIIIALLFLYANYRFMKVAYDEKGKKEKGLQKKK